MFVLLCGGGGAGAILLYLAQKYGGLRCVCVCGGGGGRGGVGGCGVEVVCGVGVGGFGLVWLVAGVVVVGCVAFVFV